MSQNIIDNGLSPAPEELKCNACGFHRFYRSTDESGCLVELKSDQQGYHDTVIREGDTTFIYECAQCSVILTVRDNTGPISFMEGTRV